MTLSTKETILILLVFMSATIITRFLPFVLFGKSAKENEKINYLGKALPYAAIALLVVFCLRHISFSAAPYGLPEIIAVAFVAFLHAKRGNTLLSIGLGTVLYMFLVQVVFV